MVIESAIALRKENLFIPPELHKTMRMLPHLIDRLAGF
jgi:hypothetical protein